MQATLPDGSPTGRERPRCAPRWARSDASRSAPAASRLASGAESHRPADASHPMRGDCMDRREGGAGPAAAPPLRVYRRRSIEVGYVGSQVLDILLREDLRDARHRACVIGPAPRLERLELFDDVLGMLAGDSGGFVLPGESAQMAHRAEHLRRLRPARRDLSGIGPEAGP